VKVSLFIKQYMDVPKDCNKPFDLEASDVRELDLLALFTDEILEITEATKVAIEVTLTYKLGESLYQDTRSETIRVYDRNAMTWDDDRKAAAFVTAKDPAVLSLSKHVAGLVREEGTRAVNVNIQTALGLHEMLDLYGLNYVIDPKTPYAELSQQQNQIDFLQFPRQTLEYRAGDCDDLSILYIALLEAVGIETALVTIPGHIFMAFNTGIASDDISRNLLVKDDLIIRNEEAWVPVEATERGRGFLQAWQAGAKQWREFYPEEQTGFFPVHEAWTTYEPVGLPGGRAETLPRDTADRLMRNFMEEQDRFINRVLFGQVASLEEKIKETGGNPRLYNRLGVLYARYGLLEKAEAEFKKIETPFAPALVNLGNIYYLKEDFYNALTYYEKAQAQDAANISIRLSIARVHHQLENFGLARRIYAEIKEADPKLAERYAYLDLRGTEGVRAANTSQAREDVLWVEN
jgi:hypothetical protein